MIEYKRLTQTELPSLLRLYPQLSEKNAYIAPERAEEVWQQAESMGIVYFGAVDGDMVVSSCYLCVIPNLTRGGRPVGFIENVITDGAYRRRGIGEKVMRMAVDCAKEMDCYFVMLASGSSRTGAHAFYEKLGFDGESKRAFEIQFP